MAAPQRLQSANISPSARPVDTFLQFNANSAPAQPTQMPKLPQPKGVVAIQRGGMRSIQGSNPLEELATALKPLSKLYDSGVQMYASDQYRRGQNEILKAAANVSRDTVVKGLQYAQDNRELSNENPMAGVLMDQSNPFRQAGRVNQASQWVAGLTPQLFQAEWIKKGSALSKLDPADPAVLQVKANVTSRLAGMFGLDEFSPGFQQYVIPQINRSSEWFSEKQIAGYTKHQKTVGVLQASEQMTSMLFDPRTTPQQWMSTVAQFGAQFGITGEPQEMIKDAILRTVGTLETIKGDLDNPRRQQAQAALEILLNMPSGIVDDNNIAVPIGRAYGRDILSDVADVSRDLKTLRDGRVAAAADALNDRLDSDTSLTMDPRAIAAQFAALRADPAFADLSNADIYAQLGVRLEDAQGFQAATFDQDSVEDFFEEQEFAIGSDWDETAANSRFRELIQEAPTALRKQLVQRWRSLRGQKASEINGQLDSTVMSTSLKNSTDAIIATILPGKGIAMLQQAEAEGLGIMEYLTRFKPDSAAAMQRVRTYLQKTASQRIRQETADKGRFLLPEEQAQIFTDVLNETLGNQDLMQRFNPQPSQTTPQATPQAQGQGATPPPAPTYHSPSAQVPEAAATSGKPIYKPTDLLSLLGTAANGEPMPGGVKRAAKANGISTGEFLLKQAELMGIPVPPEMRTKVQEVARVEQGAEQWVASAAPTSSSPLAFASNALLNILTGTAPAVAATRPPSLSTSEPQTAPAELGTPTALSSYSRQVSSVTYDTGQPGIDVFFENKRFPAVLDGRVKEVSYQGTANSGYGHYVVIESRDPQTGGTVDVLYGHLASKPGLSPGQQIKTGQVIGRQGGTGRVVSADGTIASIDFLAPAAAGSGSMAPYSNYEQLRRSIAQQLRN